jgi:hypothetical protein
MKTFLEHQAMEAGRKHIVVNPLVDEGLKRVTIPAGKPDSTTFWRT